MLEYISGENEMFRGGRNRLQEVDEHTMGTSVELDASDDLSSLSVGGKQCDCKGLAHLQRRGN